MRRLLLAAAFALVACGRTGLDLPSELGTPDGAAVASDSAIGAPDASTDVSLISTADAADVVSKVDAADVTSPPNPCNVEMCPSGCCQGDGTCVTAISESACGTGGEACQACAAGEFCKGACFQPQANCGPSNCDGCCLNPAYCANGTYNIACGQSGAQCERCDPTKGNSCLAQATGGGQCGGQATCSPTNCPGCCDGDVCQIGETATQCGSGGETCQPCPSPYACIAASPQGGLCTLPGSGCTPGSCPGCCDGAICAIGTQSIACGTDGHMCQACAAGAQCISQSCQ